MARWIFAPWAGVRMLRRIVTAGSAVALLLTTAGLGSSDAADVRIVGISPGRSATLRVDSGAPVTLAVGESLQGMRLLRVERNAAVLSVDGRNITLPLDPHRGGAARSSDRLRLTADARGHFVAPGAVNGRAIEFLVDTGASVTTLSRTEAERIGLAFRSGTRTQSMTANGVVGGWKVVVDKLRVGDVILRQIDIIIVDNATPGLALLGMNALAFFDMQREGSTLHLQHRP